jgi:hypothetical protein
MLKCRSDCEKNVVFGDDERKHFAVIVGIMQRVLCIGVFRFGPKRIPFWAKTRCILGQNASCFGPKRIPELQKTFF